MAKTIKQTKVTDFFFWSRLFFCKKFFLDNFVDNGMHSLVAWWINKKYNGFDDKIIVYTKLLNYAGTYLVVSRKVNKARPGWSSEADCDRLFPLNITLCDEVMIRLGIRLDCITVIRAWYSLISKFLFLSFLCYGAVASTILVD